jgi:Mn2+/Fe2+ NRAMP family transporter
LFNKNEFLLLFLFTKNKRVSKKTSNKNTKTMSETKQVHPLVSICQTIVCLGSLACLITGIVFLANPEQADREDPERAVVIGTILTAVGGTIFGVQVLCISVICCCGGIAVCAALCSNA